MRPRLWSRIDVSYAAPLPTLNPGGVGLCCAMKLYQSANQTAPSGPTVAATGANHSSALEIRFQPSRATKPAPCLFNSTCPMTCAVGSLTNATLFQYSFGYARAV